MQKKTRKKLIVVSFVAALIALLVVRDEDPTLREQVVELTKLRTYDVGDLTFSGWDTHGQTLNARYTADNRAGGFSLILWPSEGDARQLFVSNVAALAEHETVQEINTFEGAEHCARVDGQTRCVGYDENRFFTSFSSGEPEDLDAELDALLLLRTARKHWYRVYR